MKLIAHIETVRGALLRGSQTIAFVAPALIRLTVGLVFIAAGWGKLHSLGDVTGFFTTLGIPLPAVNARLVATTEFAGGLLILLGLGTRLVAAPLAVTMVVAILTAKRDALEGGLLSSLTTLVGFEEWSYLVMFLVLAITGAGALSLDALLARRWARPAPRGVHA